MTSTRTKKALKRDIQFGSKDLLSEDEFDPKNGKERITLFLDQQVVDAFRNLAEGKGEKYQALMREALRKVVFGKEQRSLDERVSRLEKALFKKQQS